MDSKTFNREKQKCASPFCSVSKEKLVFPDFRSRTGNYSTLMCFSNPLQFASCVFSTYYLGSRNLLWNMKKAVELLHLPDRKAFVSSPPCRPGTLLFTIPVLTHYVDAL